MNYTVEIDEHSQLYSILLFTDETVIANIPGEDDPWDEFKQAVISRDMEALSHRLRPDVELYRADDVLSINRRFADFIATPDGDFSDALFSDDTGIRSALQGQAPEQFVRVMEHAGIGLAYKFPAASPLQEIVFLPYNGRYCVYEIRFRGTKAGAAPASPTTLGSL